MNLLQTIAGLYESSGGTFRVIPALCEELARLGISVEVIMQKLRQIQEDYRVPDQELVRTTLVDGYCISRLRVVYAPRLRSFIGQVCEDRQIEILHDHGIWLPANHAAIDAARTKRIPLVVSPHGMLEPWALAYRVWKKKIAWRLYERRDLASVRLFCATSPQEAMSIRKCGFQQPIAVVPIGVSLPEPPLGGVKGPNRRTALFLSRIHPVKGLLTLVEAWKTVRPPGWRVVVAGPDEGGHRKTVEKAVATAGLGDVFEFVGPVKDEAKGRLYREADLFILPTMSENFGLVVAEALAYRVPVITTTGAPWRGLLDHSCGWWVQPEAAQLASAIREATELSSVEREAMGARGRTWMEQEFSWPSVAKRMLSVYEWILNGGHAPDCVLEAAMAP